MIGFFMALFTLLSLILALFIFIQQGKGDMGLGGMGGGSQMLFGGSGGQEFFEKATWILGAFFIFGALGISILRTGNTTSHLKGYRNTAATAQQKTPAAPVNPRAK